MLSSAFARSSILPIADLNFFNSNLSIFNEFNTIIPTIKVKSDNTTNTINSIKVNVTPMGIYGDKQIWDY